MPVFSIEQDFKVKNGLIVSNTLTVLSTANSINTNTGALILAGGAAIKGSVNIFGDLSVQGNLTANISAIANSATNLVGGSTGSIAYQSAPGITKFIEIGSANRILVSNGTTATWNDTLNLAGTTAASSTTTGALIVAGGVGIGGAVYIGTTSYILGSQIITTATVNLYASQTAIFAGTDTAVNTSTGNVTIWNTSTLQTITSRGSSTDQAISITNGTNSVSTNTGALIVSGGAGIGRDVRIGGILTATNLYVGPYPVSTNTSGIENPYPSIFTITNTTQASSTNTGALQVRGGVGISGNVYVGGTLNANATSADKLSTSRNITLTGDITGAVAFDGSTNVSIITTITADSVQLGVDTTGNYLGTGTVSGFGLSATGGTGEGSTFAITSNATSTDLINTVVFRDNVGNFDSKSIKVTTSTSATSTITGAFQVVGGVGIGSTLHVGGQVRLYSSDDTSNTLTGALVVSGSAAIGRNLRVGGNSLVVGAGSGGIITGLGGLTSTIITVTGTTSATSTNTGALRVEGGVGIGGDLYARNIYQNGTLVGQGNLTTPTGLIFTVTNVTSATSTQTGAVQIAGGVGIGGDLYVGGGIVAQRLTISLTTITTTLVTTDDIIKTENTTNSTSTTTGALQIAGGAGIAKDLYVGANGFFVGLVTATTFIGTASSAVLATLATSATNVANGTVGQIPFQTAANATSFIASGSTGTVLVSRGPNSSGPVFQNTLTLAGTTAATNTQSGAFQVAGGVGIGGAVYIGTTSYIFGNEIITTASISTYSISTTTTSTFFINNSTTSTSTNTGALVVNGGVGIGQNLNVGGNILGNTIVSSRFLQSPYSIISPQSGLNKGTGILTTVSTVIASGTNPRGIAADPTGRFVYAANFNTNNISQYSINQFTGTLTQITTAIAAGTSPEGITCDPTGRFVYAANFATNNISQYSINQSTGALTQITTAIAAGTGPVYVSVEPTGRFLFVSNSTGNSISQFSINQLTGTLTQITTAIGTISTGPRQLIVDPSGRFLFVSCSNGNQISQFSINQSTGALTTITSAIAAGTAPRGIVVDSSGRFVYVANYTSNNVSQYSINQSTGALTQITTAIAAGTNPEGITCDPTGKFVYVANNSGNLITQYSINQSTGELTQVSTITNAGSPHSIVPDPTSRFIYVTNQSNSNISQYVLQNLILGSAAIAGSFSITQDLVLIGNMRIFKGAYEYRIETDIGGNDLFRVGSTTTFFQINETSNTITLDTGNSTYTFNDDNRLSFQNGLTIFADATQTVFEGGLPILLETLTQSTSTTTGALQVSGGIGVGGYISLASSSSATGRIRWGTVHLAVRDAGDGYGSILFNSGSASTYPTSTTSTSSVIIGALAAPNAGGDSNVVIGHQAGFNITTNRNNIFIGKNAGLSVNAGSSNVIIGGYSGNDVSQLVMIASNSNVILADGSGSIKAWADAIGQWIIPNSSNSISTITGALSVRGGVGIGGNLFVGGNLNLTNASGGTLTSTNIIVSGSTNATSTNTGAFQVVGGGGIGRDLYVGGTIYQNGFAVSTGSGGLVSPFAGIFTMTNTTNAVSSTTGALQVAGGLGIQKDIFSAGKITVGLTAGIGALTGLGTLKLESNLNAISTDTGALQVVGGAAINRDLYVGGNLLVAGGQSTATSLVAFNLAMSVAFGY